MTRRAAPLLALALAVGCANAPVELTLRFPNEQAFLQSDFGRLLVYPVDPADGLGACPALVESAVSGDLGAPRYDSEQRPICALRDPGITFDDFPEGPHAFVALAYRDDPQATLLAGCRVAEAYVDAPAVEVTMFPTRFYADAVGGAPSPCTLESKCNGTCQ